VKPRPTCIEDGCDRPKWKPRHRCYWHGLLHLPIETQEAEAIRRGARSKETRSRVPEREWPAGTRYCSGCRWMVPTFYTRGRRCRACASRATHRSAVGSTYEWPAGVTYDSLLAAQGGRCGICRCTPQTRRLAVDHAHDTGLVRGLLCSICNHDLLGAAHDSLQILTNAVYYLEHPPAAHEPVLVSSRA
jgi:Recombination endonuclease VII